MEEPRRTLAARREHSKADGNFPKPEPTTTVLETPEDRPPADLPKERDARSAPKGNVTAGQAERNPALDLRDDYRPPPPGSGVEAAHDAPAEAAAPPRRLARPNARRSSAAKRDAVARSRAGGGSRGVTPTRRTGTARRGDAVNKQARGNVTARKAAKASRAKSRRRPSR